MRKFFFGLMFSSALAATVIGGVLAWNGSVSGSNSAVAGKVAVDWYKYEPTTNMVIPNYKFINVANGGLTNTGDIAVHVTGGSVQYTGWNGCSVDGQVRVTNGNPIGPGQQWAPLYAVDLRMNTDASDNCQNATLPYNVTINVAS